MSNTIAEQSQSVTDLEQIGANAQSASRSVATTDTNTKNLILNKCADALIDNEADIMAANEKDVSIAASNGSKGAFLDRLTLNKKRIMDMAEGLREIALLNDPVGEVLSMKTLPNGLIVGQKRVPLGVIAIIYESRPNVTADAFGLCFKSGNAVILRGGKEAINTNMALVALFQKVLLDNGMTGSAVQVIGDTSRDTALKLMKLNKYLDVIIPRGGAGLIQTVVENSTVPVIETGVGNCHIFVDKTADFGKSIDIVLNAKTQRPGVCNACEKLLVHSEIADEFLPLICEQLRRNNVEIRGDEYVAKKINYAVPAVADDWHTEYLDYIIGIKVVKDLDEALEHIREYSSGHSEAILTENYTNAQRFLDQVDSAAVYVNASTRFTDGYQFGFGAEIGISTQKLHARGPMGLNELTSSKYIIYGSGHIRE